MLPRVAAADASAVLEHACGLPNRDVVHPLSYLQIAAALRTGEITINQDGTGPNTARPPMNERGVVEELVSASIVFHPPDLQRPNAIASTQLCSTGAFSNAMPYG
ncbi:uncharacterized protein IUM83_18542 [Phytophthora cinnamomi]|uniref:uncharacterized protein n=1 Tax=Phytophthora cinnamomi TaxID=4785 RepID=UPI00355A1B4A|nr:hypothetical protein IUM83_18542 [Phytophthora cinnamomi]